MATYENGGPGSYKVLVGTAAVPGRKGMHIIRRGNKRSAGISDNNRK